MRLSIVLIVFSLLATLASGIMSYFIFQNWSHSWDREADYLIKFQEVKQELITTQNLIRDNTELHKVQPKKR